MALTTLIHASVIYHRHRRFNAELQRTYSQAGLEVVDDIESRELFECEGSTIFSPCESDSLPIKGSKAIDMERLQELGDEDFIKQLGSGTVKVTVCGKEVHELAAASSVHSATPQGRRSRK